MARARNIKPSFFKNELLVEMGPFDRLLFIGLWCLADREGRVEDRPKRIKMELLPCDSYDVDAGLTELARYGFIKRYEAAGVRVISITNFTKHQTPHGTEKDSELPDESGDLTTHERTGNGYVTGSKRKNNVNLPPNNVDPPLDNDAPMVDPQGANTLNPDSLNPETFSDKVVGAAAAARTPSTAAQPPAPTTAPTGTQAKATPLPTNWSLPKSWGEWALAEFPHWTPEVVRLEADKFADHWRTKSGKDARKADWPAAWRNWCRSDIAQRAHAPPRTTTAVAIETFRERDERLARAKWAEITGRHNPEQRETIDITPRPAVTLELQK